MEFADSLLIQIMSIMMTSSKQSRLIPLAQVVSQSLFQARAARQRLSKSLRTDYTGNC